MKKKILFMIINMNVGGTEKALLNMIAELPKEQYEITVLMLERYGGFLNNLPNHVYVEYVNGYKDIKKTLHSTPFRAALGKLCSRKPVKAFNLISLHLVSKIMRERTLFYKYLLKDLPVIKNEYDIAVAYAGPMDLISYFIANKVSAKRKVQWIHFDINKIGFNKYFAIKVYKKFDRLFVVSNEGKEKILKKVPALIHKTEVFSNLISSKLIVEEAIKGRGFEDDFNGIRILTVGRLAAEKGQDIAIRVLARLINDGLDVKWYCVGNGTLKKEYQTMINKLHLQERFIFLGEDPNPYHYIKTCDIYVQPSRHEGYCITLAEARALKRPIVTTDFTGAKEQIIDEKTGLIVGVHEGQIYRAVKELIRNPDLCKEFSTNLANEVPDNTVEMEKIYDLV